MIRYFAYGSNMSQEDLDRYFRSVSNRTWTERSPKVAVLEDHALEFNYYSKSRRGGAANVIASPGDTVFGLLFEVDEEEFRMIAGKEGAPHNYAETGVVVTVGDERIGARTFKVVPERETVFTKPTGAYLGLIITAAEEYGFPERYLERLRALLL